MLPFFWLLPTTRETIWILPLLLLYFGTLLLCLMPELILWTLPGELGCRASLNDAEVHWLQGSWMSKDRDCNSAGASCVRGLGTDFWGEKAENISEKRWVYISRLCRNFMLQVLLDWKYTWERATLSRKKQNRKTVYLNHCTVHCLVQKYILYRKFSFSIIFFRIMRVKIVLHIFYHCFRVYIFVGNCIPLHMP